VRMDGNFGVCFGHSEGVAADKQRSWLLIAIGYSMEHGLSLLK